MATRIWFSIDNKHYEIYKALDLEKGVKAHRVVRNRHRISYVTDKGVMYSTAVHRSGSYDRNINSIIDLVDDAIKLGVVPKSSQKAVKAVIAFKEKRREIERQGYAAQQVLCSADKVSVTLSADDRRRLNKMVATQKRIENSY